MRTDANDLYYQAIISDGIGRTENVTIMCHVRSALLVVNLPQ